MDNQITHLTKVEIKGLWGRYDIVWNLNSDVNVLAGINGSGKSTILNCLYSLVSTGQIFEPYLGMIRKIALTFNDGNNLFYEHGCLEDIEKKAIEGDPLCRNILSEIKETESYVESISFGTHEELCEKLGIDINQIITLDIINTFDTETKPQELLEKADNEVNTELDFRLWKLQKEYTKYQVRIYKTNSEVNRATHVRFLAIIDELFLETHKRVNANKEELEFLLDNKEINAYQLSSGEKQLLIILLTVLIQDNKPSILFMDEPELSLHIEWQRKLIKYIRELNPNVQLIIATHSPDIIVHGWLDNVFNLQDLIVKDNMPL